MVLDDVSRNKQAVGNSPPRADASAKPLAGFVGVSKTYRDLFVSRRSVVASCTRAGGVVVWNDLETSWDCPVCGSRFDVDGSVLEGGARGPLKPVGTPGAPEDPSGR